MKKIFIALAILASVQVAGAQSKAIVDAKKAVDSAKAAADNPKKAAKAATWVKLGEAYVAAHEAPSGNLWLNATKQELAIVMGNEKPSSSETVILGGEQVTKEVYAEKNLYFRDSNGQLAAIEVTKPVVEDALAKAFDAYKKAYSIDSKSKVSAALEDISQKMINDAYTEYLIGNFSAGSVLFEKAADVMNTAPVSKIDTLSLYNAGYLAQNAKDNARAIKFFKQCYDYGFYGADGELFAKLADVDPDNTKLYLEAGFAKFPQSQSILIGLINYYLTNNESTDKLFELVETAKKNEPTNASLYYVEGNIRVELKEYDKALEAYNQCSVVDPNYEYGFIGAGIMYYNLAIELQEKAQAELDDAKYMQLAADFEKALKNCIEPFEKAFNLTKDPQVKISVAEYLKNSCYRFRDESASYQESYDKYSAYLENN